MLEMENIQVFYGPIQALHGVSLKVEEGEIVTIIGSNGAGKTTTLKSITGLVRPRSGQIKFCGKSIERRPEESIVAMGISLVPEGRRVFPELTVLENLEIGAYLRRSDREGIARDLKHVYEVFPRLEERKKQLGRTLSGGEQQMLAIARALMSRPKLLMLDEPSMGLAPLVVADIFNVIERLNEEGTTILLVEQNAKMALKIADRGYVLRTGEITMEASATDLLNDEGVRRAYLGEGVYATTAHSG